MLIGAELTRCDRANSASDMPAANRELSERKNSNQDKEIGNILRGGKRTVFNLYSNPLALGDVQVRRRFSSVISTANRL